MERKSTKLRSRISFVLLMLVMSAVAGAQNAPQSPSAMQAILDRLDQLEKDNQALLDQVRALRQEISTLQAPAAPGQAVSPADAKPENSVQGASGERQAIVESRMEELAQTKVEASQKFPIRISGMALFNASSNGRFNGDFENPLVASLTPGQATGGGTLRQSTLGFLFNGPETFANGKISGSLYLDFFGGSTLSLNHLIRLRTAAINIDWKNTSLMFGQDKPLISPRDPDSFAQVGYSPLSGAGNLWLWLPQARLEQRLSLGENTGVRAQASVIATSSLDYPSARPAGQNSAEQADSWPGAEGRLEFWHRWGNTNRVELGGGYHFNQNRIIESRVPTELYSFDWFLRPISKLEFSGAVFHGENVPTLGSLPQGFMLQMYEGRVTSVTTVHSTGGWAQIRVPITERLAWDVYSGQQDDRNSDLGFGFISKNQGYFSNLMYRIAPNVIVSFEAGQLRTTYLSLGTHLNDHYDLAVAYLF